MSIVTDGEKYYLIEGGQVVAAADSKEALVETPTVVVASVIEATFEVGDRVEVSGRLGTIKTMVTSVYGDVAGIKLDNGSIEEVLTDVLTHTEAEEPTYANEVEALVAEFETYEARTVVGIDDVRQKSAKARQLNLRAKAIATDPQLGFSDRVKLDKIVLTTGVDIVELRDDEQILASADYIAEQPRFEVEIGHSNPHPSEDASWLLEAAEQVDEEASGIDWDAVIATEAVALAQRINEGLLDDDDYVIATAAEHGLHFVAGLEDAEERGNQFVQFVVKAASTRRESLEKTATQKTAALELSDDDDTFQALFL